MDNNAPMATAKTKVSTTLERLVVIRTRTDSAMIALEGLLIRVRGDTSPDLRDDDEKAMNTHQTVLVDIENSLIDLQKRVEELGELI